MARLLAATVSLSLVCHGGAFSGTGSVLARPCSGAQHPPAWPPRAGCAGRTSRAFAAGGRHATGGCPANHLYLPSANGVDQPTRMRAKSDGVTGGDTEVRQDHESYLIDRMARVPILGILVRFARWVASIFRSILLVRMAVLLQAVAQAKTALLDPQRRLVSFIPNTLPTPSSSRTFSYNRCGVMLSFPFLAEFRFASSCTQISVWAHSMLVAGMSCMTPNPMSFWDAFCCSNARLRLSHSRPREMWLGPRDLRHQSRVHRLPLQDRPMMARRQAQIGSQSPAQR